MQRFLAEQNIQHFNDLLARETDEARRALIQSMIAEEEAKLSAAKVQARGGPSSVKD